MKAHSKLRKDSQSGTPQPAEFTNEYANFQRIHQWSQKSVAGPPSNRARAVVEDENVDFEKKSQLIAEGVNLLDNRERQTRGEIPAPNFLFGNHIETGVPFESGKRSRPNKQEGHHKSGPSARKFVQDFEERMNRKKAYSAAIASTYPPPPVKSFKRKFSKASSKLRSTNPFVNSVPPGPVVEPDSWRFRASRSVKFGVKLGTQQGGARENPSEISDDKWSGQQENNPEWWRLKLKQRFLQNDELLNKLVLQRKKFEMSRMALGGFRVAESKLFSNKPVTEPVANTFKDNGSWHVSLEIPSRTKTHSTLISSSGGDEGGSGKTREPMPMFYTPSKQLVAALMSTPNAANTSHHLKVLQKDPYLSKLLQGKNAFKPETMLGTIKRTKVASFSPSSKQTETMRRKLSLESLSDTEVLKPATFFNPDVKVLYERLSDLEVLNNQQDSSKPVIQNHRNASYEPSDGYLNLSLLLEKGRFNGYNKLPSMKFIEAARDRQQSNSKQRSKYGKTPSNMTRSRNSNVIGNSQTKGKFNSSGLLKMSTAPTIGVDGSPGSVLLRPNLESLPTTEWAKHIMSKAKKQVTPTSLDLTKGKVVKTMFPRRSEEMNEILNFQHQTYKVPFDQETNLLYHEILMSKWKKDKHGKEKDGPHARTKLVDSINKWKSGEQKYLDKEHDDDIKKSINGLDIWLENIREKAKRDNVITGDKGVPRNSRDSERIPSLNIGKSIVAN